MTIRPKNCQHDSSSSPTSSGEISGKSKKWFGRFLLSSIVLVIALIGWELFWLSREIQVCSTLPLPPNDLGFHPPSFYETGDVKAGSYCIIDGQAHMLARFNDNPVLILIDGTRSRFWKSGDFAQTVCTCDYGSEITFPASGNAAIILRLKTQGTPLPSKPNITRSFFQDLLGKIAFGNDGAADKRRFFLALEGNRLNSPEENSHDQTDYVARLERFLLKPSFLLKTALARKKLESEEIQEERDWIRQQYLGFPTFISSRLATETIRTLSNLIDEQNIDYPFINFTRCTTGKDLSLIFLKMMRNGGDSRPRFQEFPRHGRVVIRLDENRWNPAGTFGTLAHEMFHALQWACDDTPFPYDTNESLSFVESGAQWFQHFNEGRCNGLDIGRNPFKPGMCSLWPLGKVSKGPDSGHYNQYGFLHWIFLRMKISPEEFVNALLKATRKGKFHDLIRQIGYENLWQARQDYLAFCWWNSLDRPESSESPFVDYFSSLSREAFFVRDSDNRFGEIYSEIDMDQSDSYKFLSTPGNSLFLKGNTAALDERWQISGQRTERELVIYIAFLEKEKYLSHRRLKSFDDISGLFRRKLIPGQYG